MTANAAEAEQTPATVPTLQDRAAQLATFGWTDREAEWIALVALHNGAFTRSQWRHYYYFVRSAIAPTVALRCALGSVAVGRRDTP